MSFKNKLSTAQTGFAMFNQKLPSIFRSRAIFWAGTVQYISFQFCPFALLKQHEKYLIYPSLPEFSLASFSDCNLRINLPPLPNCIAGTPDVASPIIRSAGVRGLRSNLEPPCRALLLTIWAVSCSNVQISSWEYLHLLVSKFLCICFLYIVLLWVPLYALFSRPFCYFSGSPFQAYEPSQSHEEAISGVRVGKFHVFDGTGGAFKYDILSLSHLPLVCWD
jgi:hypothetical protein